MSKRVQLRRGTAVENNNFTGAVGEVTVDTTSNTLRVHDGTTAGGTELAKTDQLPEAATVNSAGIIELATPAEVYDGSVTDKAVTPMTLRVGVRNHLNAFGDAPIYACRAWVNFNGTGTVAIRGSGNVSSITDNGVGDYSVNLTTAMQDLNFAANATTTRYTEDTYLSGANAEIASTSTIRIYTGAVSAYTNRENHDPLLVSVTVFR